MAMAKALAAGESRAKGMQRNNKISGEESVAHGGISQQPGENPAGAATASKWRRRAEKLKAVALAGGKQRHHGSMAAKNRWAAIARAGGSAKLSQQSWQHGRSAARWQQLQLALISHGSISERQPLASSALLAGSQHRYPAAALAAPVPSRIALALGGGKNAAKKNGVSAALIGKAAAISSISAASLKTSRR
jgi:hypothetical protein